MALFLKMTPIICCFSEQFVRRCVLVRLPGRQTASITTRKLQEEGLTKHQILRIYEVSPLCSSGILGCVMTDRPNQSVAVLVLT